MSNQPLPLAVRPVRAFSDNYIWLIESPRATGRVVAVDPGDAAPVIAELRRSGASLAAILLTHHHPDHIGGVSDLLTLGKVPVIGPDDDRIPGRTRTLRDGDRCGGCRCLASSCRRPCRSRNRARRRSRIYAEGRGPLDGPL